MVPSTYYERVQSQGLSPELQDLRTICLLKFPICKSHESFMFNTSQTELNTLPLLPPPSGPILFPQQFTFK